MMGVTAMLKAEGFDGQKAIVIPKSILKKFCISNKLIQNAYITDIGYYPNAKFHFRKREKGSEQHILIYCNEGSGTIEIAGETCILRGGDFVLIPQHTKHEYHTSPENPWTIYWCHFRGSQTDEMVKRNKMTNKSYKGSVPYLESRTALFNTLYQRLEHGYSFENLTCVNIIFLQYLTSFLFPKAYHVAPAPDADDVIEKSFRFMQDNITKRLILADIAQHINKSPSHLSSSFKKRTGFSPIDYFNHLKIQKACQYLQFTNLKIKQIAFEVGFDDQYYFSRLFTKTMASTPTAYREQCLAGM